MVSKTAAGIRFLWSANIASHFCTSIVKTLCRSVNPLIDSLQWVTEGGRHGAAALLLTG